MTTCTVVDDTDMIQITKCTVVHDTDVIQNTKWTSPVRPGRPGEGASSRWQPMVVLREVVLVQVRSSVLRRRAPGCDARVLRGGVLGLGGGGLLAILSLV